MKFLISYRILLLQFFLLDISYSSSTPPLITNNIGGGRLGDQLLVYVKAKWFSYYYKGSFVLTPFDGFEQFQFFHFEKHKDDNTSYKKVLLDDEKPLLEDNKDNNTLYLIHLKSKSSLWGHWYDHTTWHACIDDPVFKAHIQTMLQPVHPGPFIELPKDRISVALHVRKGGGFDKPTLSSRDGMHYADLAAPLKFPPDSFYIAALRYLSLMLDDIPLYVYLFTDDKNPESIVDTYTHALNKTNIVFDFRHIGNIHNAHVVEDMVNMSHFDCLIRPESSFSKIAEIMGNHKIVLFPHASRWEQDTLYITHMTIMNGGIRSIITM